MPNAMRPIELYESFNAWIGNGTGLPDTVLHIHGGLAVLMIARMVTGRSLGTFAPLSVVVIAEIAKEVLDRLVYDSWRWPDTLSDVAHTLFWPTVICIGVRLRPMIERRRTSAAVMSAIPADEAG